LNVSSAKAALKDAVKKLNAAGVQVSLFVEPTVEAVQASREIGAQAVELHTGVYARVFRTGHFKNELEKIVAAAHAGKSAGLLVNAGHGLDYDNVEALLQAFSFDEFNIGFAIVARAFSVGMEGAVSEMKRRLVNTPCAAS
jgi:pyridoxine 5-phosphate synthase